MSVPKQKKAVSRTKRGRSHDSLGATALHTCEQCKKEKLSHTACQHCGYYKGRQVKKVTL